MAKKIASEQAEKSPATKPRLGPRKPEGDESAEFEDDEDLVYPGANIAEGETELLNINVYNEEAVDALNDYDFET